MGPTPEEIRHMEHMHTKMSYNQITDYIYAGNNLCCQTHFDTELLSKGIAADISIESERLDNPLTIGNIIGGAIFVGLLYWMVYVKGTQIK